MPRATHRIRLRHGVLALALVGLTLTPIEALADTAADARDLVDKARQTIEDFTADPDMGWFRDNLPDAKAVMVVPVLIKGGFILGGSGGHGVVLWRDAASGRWSYPSFTFMGSITFGLQIGGEMSEVVFTIMNDGAITAILDHQFKLGADASVAVGPIGKGIEASTTTNLSDDIYAFSKSVGLFGGGVLEGAMIVKRTSWNELYYAAGADPQKILVERMFFNPHADRLRASLPN